ncbi:MAG: hypothetical protein J6C67_03635 [Muribaculaceae bacterium]|nr:hypothetical protein [Muribaculaceae bacterium]
MSPYKRAKKEETIKPLKKMLSIEVGSVKDSFESLQSMCNDKANELIKTVEVEPGEQMQVEFWTEDIPEFIGVANISVNHAGLITYSMDYSETTL